MNKTYYIRLLVSYVFALLAATPAIVDISFGTSFSEIVYNPIVMMPLFFAIFYYVVGFELKALSERLSRLNIKPLFVFTIIFSIIVTLSAAYIVIADARGIGNFASNAEQGNYFQSFFNYMFIASVALITIVSALFTFLTSKNYKNKIEDVLAINLTFFPLNYLVAVIITSVFNIVFFIFQLSG